MMTLLFCCLSFSLSFSFIFMSHPLAMGLALLSQTLLLTMSTGLLLPTFWFSYILFLVFLGGMLVLFIYVASLASNEMFNISMKLILIMSFLMCILIIMMTLSDFMIFNNMISFFNSFDFFSVPDLYKTYVFKMYNIMNFILTFMMILYLLLALVIVANIVTIQEGPLRPLT